MNCNGELLILTRYLLIDGLFMEAKHIVSFLLLLLGVTLSRRSRESCPWHLLLLGIDRLSIQFHLGHRLDRTEIPRILGTVEIEHFYVDDFITASSLFFPEPFENLRAAHV